MAAAQILATASTAADSSDVVVAAGTPITVALKGVVSGDAFVTVSLKDDATAYTVIGSLDPSNWAVELSAPGTYRFSRRAGAACGVFSA